MPKSVTRDEIKAGLETEAGPVLVEALPEKYFQDGHLPGAVHIPHDEVNALASKLLPDKGAGIVVYCASETCRNSQVAAESLERLGYRDVAVYPGGKKDWSEAGLPLE